MKRIKIYSGKSLFMNRLSKLIPGKGNRLRLNLKAAFLFLLVFPLAFSCSDFLEPKQVDLVYNEVFWENEKDAETGLLGVYSLYRGLMADGNWYERGDATTGFVNRGWNGGSSSNLYTPGDFSTSSSSQRSWGSLESYSDWSKFYKVVAHANLVIKKIEQMPDDLFNGNNKKQFLGEAYFLRGLVYFNILRNWGNAPYISESIESSTQVINDDLTPIVIGRTKDTDIALNIISDVEKSMSFLEHKTVGSASWGIRANKGSAEALAGHVFMWMNFLANRDNLPNPEQYITKAITALESLETNGGYSLTDYSLADAVQKLYDGQSSEAVFELNISTEQNESYRADYGGVVALTSKMTPLDGDATKDRASNVDYVPKSQKALIYPDYNFETQTGDLRAELFFDAWHSPYNEPFSDVSATSTDRNLVTWLKKYSQVTVDASHSWNEYIAYFAEANIPVFRYTDAHLLLAEAYAKSNQPGKAKVIVDQIRGRAGLQPYAGNDILKEVLQQRVSELIGEGQLFYDMVRNNYFANQQVMDNARYQQQGYYWPVSSNILISNKLISQTPYWNGKTLW